MTRTIAIVSGKGGVGKTVSTINLGSALQELNQDVVLIDADTTTSNLGLQLGLYSFPITLEDIMHKNADIMHAIHIHPTGLRLIPSPLAPTKSDFIATKLKKHLEKLNSIVLIDSPPGLNKDALGVLDAADEILLVTNPEVPAVTDAVKVLQATRKLYPDKNILGVVLNRQRGKEFELKIHEIENICEAPVIGTINEDQNIKRSVNEKTPLVKYRPHSKASLDYKRIAARLVEKEFEIPSFPKIRHIMDSFKKN